MNDEAMFRSAEMSLAQFYVSKEVSKEIIRELGELGCVHFRDLNPEVSSFQRAFVNEIKVVENCLRQIRLLRKHINAFSIIESPVWDGQRISDPDSLTSTLNQLESQVTDLNSRVEQIKDKEANLIEYRYVLRAMTNFFGSNHFFNSSNGSNVVAGIIPTHLTQSLERLTWRALRGNLIFSASELGVPIWDRQSKSAIDKSVFILVTHGHQLSQKARKISESMEAHIYSVIEGFTTDELDSVNKKLQELRKINGYTIQALEAELVSVAKDIKLWDLHLQREKMVHETLNKFSYDPSRRVLIGEGWVPSDKVTSVQQTLKLVSESAELESPAILTLLNTNRNPPTLHRTNKVTEAFQNMVDVYATASYREVNPALPTVVTFPFFFAVMFGDIGHGFLMVLAALFVVLNERKLAKFQGGDVFDMFYSGRYVILLMGAFSMFTGLLYNDLFSKSMTLFRSGWEWPADANPNGAITAVNTGRVYKIGIDWMWHGAENNLRFMNSYKMKLSVIMGYIHMLYSYMFSLVNHVYFKSKIDIIGNFIPGLIFFLSIFGYLSITIVYKWTIDWSKTDAQPPSLMNMLINMFLSPGKIDQPLYKGQRLVQVFLLVAALISVVWLLFCKPLYLLRKMQNKRSSILNDEFSGTDLDILEGDEDHEQESFGDIMIEQAIHTIEFCLNSVSHTASYLRLWALSLAHSQLSQVLWDMTLKLGFGQTGVIGVIMVIVMFAVWMSLTVAILTIMEGTSAMLHALRLHWVESMSKFYIGEGYAFEPFSFATIEA